MRKYLNNLQKWFNVRMYKLMVLVNGVIIIYRYNNKTYRIDDIAWDHTPNNTFTKGDTEISFKNYFKTVA